MIANHKKGESFSSLERVNIYVRHRPNVLYVTDMDKILRTETPKWPILFRYIMTAYLFLKKTYSSGIFQIIFGIISIFAEVLEMLVIHNRRCYFPIGTGIWVGSFFIISGILVVCGYKNKDSINEESKLVHVIFLILNMISALGAITMIILAIYAYLDRFGLVMNWF